MAADRLLPERLASDPRRHDLRRRLSLAEAGDAQGAGEVGGRVLERMLDVLFGHLDLEADPALGQLFDFRPHCEPFCQNCVSVPGVARVEVTVSPGAARSELVGRHGDGWKARVAAPPERGRANDALIELLASALAVRRDQVEVVAGHRGRRKLVEVRGLDAAEIDRRLARLVE